MKQLWNWLLLALVVIEIVFIRLELLSVRAAVGIFVALEAIALLVAARQLVVVLRQYRRDRQQGLDLWAALENGLGVVLPRRLARVVVMEAKIWFSLYRWPFMCTKLEEDEFRYHGRSPLGMWLVVLLFTTPVEILLAEVLVSWAWLRWLILVGAVYAFVWLLGFYSSLATFPHRLKTATLHLAYGAFTSVEIPYADIVKVDVQRVPCPGRREGLYVTPGSDAAYLAVGGRTDVYLRLRNPYPLQSWSRPSRPVSTIHIAADEPKRLAEAVGKRMAGSIS